MIEIRKCPRQEPHTFAVAKEREEPPYLRRDIALAWNYADRELLRKIELRASYEALQETT